MQTEFRMHVHEDTSMITNARNARNARFVRFVLCALSGKKNARKQKISELRKDLRPPPRII